MTREELREIARCYAHDELKDNHGDVEDIVASAFIDGVNYADAHPRWISVEDELPTELEPVLAAFGNHYARVCFYNGGKWYIDAGVMSDEAFGVSHWIQIPPPPKKGGEE